ncbi:MAG: LON peptidase substrate-binding domain-containing protein [Rhodocyclaceae bacterium]|jgi:hypothetical protein|nr:LON peptidase substrate-binding domain-containing protein [Rhodocyclaceae bacterium]
MSRSLEIPLFPLATVLYPEGLLPLRIFEPRYMDMAKCCLRDDSTFGICLIASGREVGPAAEPHVVGTLARIASWDMPQLGLLQVIVQGERRFRVLGRRVEASGLLRGNVELLPQEPSQPVPEAFLRLIPLLRRTLGESGELGATRPYRFEDALWVGYRFCELLNLPNPLKQELLELDDCIERLTEVFYICAQRGLLET